VIAPRRSLRSPEVLFWDNWKSGDDFVIDSYRTVDPLRTLFYYPRERVLPARMIVEKRLVVGAKACDLQALKVLDKALNNADFIDPLYEQWRKNTTIISVDCNEIAPTCHCNLVGGKPYVEEDYDLNLTKIDAEFYDLEVASAKGQILLELLQKELKINRSSEEDSRAVRETRRSVEKKLHLQNKDYERGDEYKYLRKADLTKWVEEAAHCCGCGGCTNICPTCYCMILNDESAGDTFIKERSADSCQVHGYARVAGGASPRPKMFERFRNRYLCKFDYMVYNFGVLGCTGCGRCSEVCAGKIEFREVVKRIMSFGKITEAANV
jgi:ferredoxin